MSTMDAKVPPVVWALTGLLVQGLFKGKRPPRFVRAVALLVLVATASLGFWAVRSFQRHGTTVDPHHPAAVTTLITDGAHSITRNPMYTALLGGLVSVALWRGRTAALLPVVAVFSALNTFQVPAEEAALEAAFGADFQRYKNSVPRWI